MGVAVVSTVMSTAFLAASSAWRVVKVGRVAHVGVVLFSEKGFALDTYRRDTKNHPIARTRVFAGGSH